MDTEGHVELTLELREHGWADIAVKVGDAECVMDWISYCCDAFGDLLRAALMIAEGAPSAVCSFDREPAEWRLLLEARPLHGARWIDGVRHPMSLAERLLTLGSRVNGGSS